MVQIDINIPALVSHVQIQDQPHFKLRPLFLLNPQITHRRYQNAITLLKKELRQFFKYYHLNRQNAAQLLWFTFDPEIEYLHQPLDFRMGRLQIKGKLGCVRFKVNELCVVCLPGLNNLMYIEHTGDQDPGLDVTKLERFVKHHLKKEKESLGEDFDPQLYFSSKKDFLTHIPLKLDLKFAKINYGKSEADQFFARFFATPEFHGATEIQRVGVDLNEGFPEQLKRAFYREREIEQLYPALYQSQNTPIAIVGAEGVGKRTLVQEALYRYLHKNRESDDQRLISLWQVDPTRIIAGMSVVGYWQQRFEAIIRYLIKPFPDKSVSHKMLIDNPIALLRIGRSAQNDMTLSDVLKPYLEKRTLQVVLIATPEEWTVFREEDRSFSGLFQVLRLQEPEEETAVHMLLEERKALEREHEVSFNISAVQQLLFLHRNYLRSKALPGAIARLMQQLAVKYKGGNVQAEHVRSTFQRMSGLQERIFDTAYTYEAGEVRQELGRHLIGQQEAIEVLADVVHLFKSKLNDKSKPVSSLLFIGPTGVGKTQAAKVLARYLLGSDDHLLRFDMNEYIDGAAPQRLIGDDYNPEGQLTGKVRYQPFSVVLFDEIEKSHPQVRDLLLQLLDDGRLTDSMGRTVDFTNTIVIMTSNLGAQDVNRMININRTEEAEGLVYKRAVEKHFRPEFINRIDKMVVFHKLELGDILDIARLQIDELLNRDGFVRRTTIVNIEKNALEWVARRGFDEKMGGRALRRQIEQDLTSLSAEQLLRIRSRSPILMNIRLKDGHLQPQIRPLTFTKANPETLFPELDHIRKGGAFYRWLLNNTEQIQAEINAREEFHPPREDDWIYYQFKTRIELIKEQLRTIMIAYEDPNYLSAGALRLKQCIAGGKKEIMRRGSGKADLQDRLFQEAALQEINDVYRYTSPEFDNKYSEFVGHYLDVAFLGLFAQGVMEGEKDRLQLRIQSLINNQGEKEIDYLLDRYSALFKHLDLPFHTDRDRHRITVEGYRLQQLLAGEHGLHLFYLAQRNPLPISVDLVLDQNPVETNLNVVRIYDNNKTLTDLRTNYTNDFHISPEEFKLLLYGGIPAVVREQLLDDTFVS